MSLAGTQTHKDQASLIVVHIVDTVLSLNGHVLANKVVIVVSFCLSTVSEFFAENLKLAEGEVLVVQEWLQWYEIFTVQ